MEVKEFNNTDDVNDIVGQFDRLNDEKQLELLGILLEKMTSGEIEIKGRPIYPEEIGIDDSFACCTTIVDMLCK